MRRTIGIQEEAHTRLVILQADAMKKLKRQVSLGEVVLALIDYAQISHEHGGVHHRVWTDGMDEG